MRFGDLPPWAKELSTGIHEVVQYGDYDPESMEMDKQEFIFPSELLKREPLFNQLIVNSYQPGEVRHDLFHTFVHHIYSIEIEMREKKEV